MKQVRDHLYIGNIQDAHLVVKEIYPNITHMLSLLTYQFTDQPPPKVGDPYFPVTVRSGRPPSPPPSANASDDTDPKSKTAERPELVCMTVPLRDMESENLLDHLEACLEYIEGGIKIGNVLVHCFAGVSRSASVVTAYLMRTERLSVDDALSELRKVSPAVCPNEGFMDQLQMFEEMRFKVDHTHPVYKRFHVSNLGAAHIKGQKIESSRFASDPGEVCTSLAQTFASKLNTIEESRVPSLYRCRKCRRLVASESNLLAHTLGMGEASFKAKKKTSGHFDDEYGQPECSSIFVEPMRWMASVLEGQVEGPLSCASCQARLGNFNWAGLQCSCGTWVNPAFQLHKSRMDFTWL